MKIRQPGFTLIELIVVMVVTGVLAASLAIFFRPAMDNYVASGRRATLSDLADGAMRRMNRDIRMAVPNSLRQPNTQCFELVPASSGGKFRTAEDAVNTAGASKALDANNPGTVFDAIVSLTAIPAAGDLLVIGNQNAADLYAQTTLNTIQSTARAGASGGPPASANSGTVIGTDRITLGATAKIPPGYEGGRYFLVSPTQRAVTYACVNAGLDARGTGTGTLYRFSNYGFNAAISSCPTPNTATPVLATRVASCNFAYDPNPGAIQGSGYMRISLGLSEAGETVTLQYGAHTDNYP
ncbi:prepilin-type N-terminal cleavage/methylation domain-containing protein [Massilia sp. NR 4-1]|uniref:prepilin-type N-terminal cleavage/methylation domain-containing protein n=1 Tax=Massilia sp. NR 4-1 TaxID=1678028 RepID=UPI00067BC8EE|nr:prepilin-type N-terminal cleavage/methylation domain-containing protein [Massilia sp. NR 4-1]AKU21357.1 hypothetical protein ACZ75_07555 [Massilia sp. NR 4-1]